MIQPDNTQWLDEILEWRQDAYSALMKELPGIDISDGKHTEIVSNRIRNEYKDKAKKAILSHIQANYTPNSEVERLKREARLLGRKDIADKAREHTERADFFHPETEVVLTSSLEWLASLEQLSNQENK